MDCFFNFVSLRKIKSNRRDAQALFWITLGCNATAIHSAGSVASHWVNMSCLSKVKS